MHFVFYIIIYKLLESSSSSISDADSTEVQAEMQIEKPESKPLEVLHASQKIYNNYGYFACSGYMQLYNSFSAAVNHPKPDMITTDADDEDLQAKIATYKQMSRARDKEISALKKQMSVIESWKVS